MKRLLTIILVIAIALTLFGCNYVVKSVHVNVENNDELSGEKLGRSAMVEIGDNLWYDSTTRIVYWWNGNLYANSYSVTTPTPYYAPNGLPYRYNPDTNSFEEIDIYG